jgi:predicted nucleotidyltransferase
VNLTGALQAVKKMTLKQVKTATLPDLWHKSILKKKVDQEKNRIEVLRQVKEALNILEKKYQWEEAYLFGSIVTEGRFRRNSDVDIAVSGLKKFDYYEFIGEISDLLNKRVDVVLLEECQLAPFIKEKGVKWNRKSRL